MQRSSESIACLAAALPKAQAELTNPEKSLVATIRPNGPGEAERSFRYAPLSSGLEEAVIIADTMPSRPWNGNWRCDWPVCLRGATTMETGLFEIQAEHLVGLR